MNLLLLHQGAIGDFVLTLSAVQAVVKAAGTGTHRVTAVASAPSAKLASGRSVIDERISPDAVGLHVLFADGGEVGETLAGLLRRSDLVLNFLGYSAHRSHATLSRYVKRLVSIDPRPTAETIKRRRHITTQWVGAMRDGGLDVVEASPPEIRMDRAGGEPRGVVIHPGSGGRGKCWPIERFFELVDACVERPVCWLAGPAELEHAGLMSSLRRRCADREGEELVACEDVESAARCIVDGSMFVGNDAGMTHVAAALGMTTVALFGPTDPRVWAPLGGRVRVAATDAPGEAMERLSVERVLEAVGRRG